MSYLACVCGFSCGTRNALDKHLSKNEGSDGHGVTEWTKKLIELSDQFAKFDKTGDHQLDLSELTALLRRGKKVKMTDREIRMLFKAADKDKDDLISFEEFLAYVYTPTTAQDVDDSLDEQTTSTANWPCDKPVNERSAISSPGRQRAHAQVAQEHPPTATEKARSGLPRPATSPKMSSPSSPGPRVRLTEDIRSCSSSPNARAGSHELDAAVRFILVRHGKSANKTRVAGEAASSDPELAEQGYEQAEALGKRLAANLKHMQQGDLIIASSPMRRCILTIRPAVYRLNLAPGDCICHGGCYEFGCAGLDNRGTSVAEIAVNFPEFIPVCFSADGGWDYVGSNAKENEEDARGRGVRIVNWIWEMASTLSKRPSRRTKVLVLAAHQTISDLICQLLVEGTADNWSYGQMKYRLQNTAMTEIILQGNGEAILAKSNDYAHLRDIAGSPCCASLNLSGELLSITTSQGTAKLLATLRSKFSQIDATGDHKLDFKEMSVLLRRGDPELSDHELTSLFNAADTTQDGLLNFDEFLDFIFKQEKADGWFSPRDLFR